MIEEVIEIDLPDGLSKIVLTRPIKIKTIDTDISVGGPWFQIICKELQIYSSGENRKKAWKDFCDFFTEDYRHWMDSDGERLTQDAIELKNKYKELVHGRDSIV